MCVTSFRQYVHFRYCSSNAVYTHADDRASSLPVHTAKKRHEEAISTPQNSNGKGINRSLNCRSCTHPESIAPIPTIAQNARTKKEDVEKIQTWRVCNQRSSCSGGIVLVLLGASLSLHGRARALSCAPHHPDGGSNESDGRRFAIVEAAVEGGAVPSGAVGVESCLGGSRCIAEGDCPRGRYRGGVGNRSLLFPAAGASCGGVDDMANEKKD